MEQFQVAQINIGRIKGVSIDDPIMKEFVDNLDRVNALAENSKGFIWRPFLGTWLQHRQCLAAVAERWITEAIAHQEMEQSYYMVLSGRKLHGLF